MRLDANQIGVYAANAGFKGLDLTVSVAIALAESSGDTEAYNPEVAAGTPDGQGSYGLWQIYRNVHPEFSALDLNDPQENANAAFQVYTAALARFTPWSTYKNGAYTDHMRIAWNGVNNT